MAQQLGPLDPVGGTTAHLEEGLLPALTMVYTQNFVRRPSPVASLVNIGSHRYLTVNEAPIWSSHVALPPANVVGFEVPGYMSTYG